MNNGEGNFGSRPYPYRLATFKYSCLGLDPTFTYNTTRLDSFTKYFFFFQNIIPLQKSASSHYYEPR